MFCGCTAVILSVMGHLFHSVFRNEMLVVDEFVKSICEYALSDMFVLTEVVLSRAWLRKKFLSSSRLIHLLSHQGSSSDQYVE